MSANGKKNGTERLKPFNASAEEREKREAAEVIRLFHVARHEAEKSMTPPEENISEHKAPLAAESMRDGEKAPSRMQMLEVPTERLPYEGIVMPTPEKWTRMDRRLRESFRESRIKTARRRQFKSTVVPIARKAALVAAVAALAFVSVMLIQNWGGIADVIRRLFSSPQPVVGSLEEPIKLARIIFDNLKAG